MMKLTDLFVSIFILTFGVNSNSDSLILLLIASIPATLITLLKRVEIKYTLLKNLFVLKYVYQLK